MSCNKAAVTQIRVSIGFFWRYGSVALSLRAIDSAICATSSEWVSRFRKKSDSWPGKSCVFPCSLRKLGEWMTRAKSLSTSDRPGVADLPSFLYRLKS